MTVTTITMIPIGKKLKLKPLRSKWILTRFHSFPDNCPRFLFEEMLRGRSSRFSHQSKAFIDLLPWAH